MAETDGERVVPGEVDADLWNEHMARYAFAARLSRMKRVLDAGCGAGYGAAELARSALSVTGLDVSGEAIAYAREHYPLPNLRFLRASCEAFPFPADSFDLVVAFEVIEHLRDARAFVEEARRVLTPGGQCVISTPNQAYYGASRGPTGPNPYHTREYSFEEFREELRRVFPHVSLFLQNRVEGFVFQPAKTFTPAEARLESSGGAPEDAHFFLAVCATSAQTGAPTFLFVPRAANLLREREQHIERLQQQIARIQAERDDLLEMFRRQTEQLEERNRWAGRLNEDLERAGTTIRELQAELETQAHGYEAKVAELEDDSRRKTEWALETETRLSEALADKVQELGHCVEALHGVERTLEERTLWAQSLDERVRELEEQVNLARASRWLKLGNALGIGPRLRNE